MTDPSPPGDPLAMLRTRGYLSLLGLGAVLGIPVSAAAFGFLALVRLVQQEVFTHLPRGLGFAGEPVWWPLPVLGVAGVLVALAVTRLPGTGGHPPARGFSAGLTQPVDLPGVVAAALGTLGLGAVLGPEAPLIALGSGLAVWTVRRVRRGAPATAELVLGAAGSFAALGTILGSPIAAALFMMEAVGLGGAALSLVLLPGLLAAGVGSLVFIGLGRWSGLGSFTLAIPGLPAVARPTASELAWALAMGLAAALAGVGIRRVALRLEALVSGRLVLWLPVAGVAVAGAAVLYAETTGGPTSDVLFSGQDLVGPLVQHAATWTVGSLVALLALKGVAYALSLSGFRGGPIFPALLLGAAGGVAASHLPGLGLVPAVAMGMGAMSAAMLRLPVVSVVLPALLMAHDAFAVTPVVIVAVVVAYVTVSWIDPQPAAAPALAGS